MHPLRALLAPAALVLAPLVGAAPTPAQDGGPGAHAPVIDPDPAPDLDPDFDPDFDFDFDFDDDGGDGGGGGDRFDFGALSLEELLDVEIEVTTAGRKAQSVLRTPAAVFVLTAEDIRRSGATSIPDALRMVPGLQVAQANASTWAISSRGFNGIYATKLLVLIDGRSVYSPLFSGVYWDVQDVLLEDVERIEVIRGPGAALWGANAVNGIINIVTKRAQDTQGTAVTTLVGTRERSASIRHGGLFGDDGAFRFYAKGVERDGLRGDTGGDADDSFEMGQAGFRADWRATQRDSLTVQGDAYAGQSDPPFTLRSAMPPFEEPQGQDIDLYGGNLIGRWTRTLSETQELSFQAYYDHYSRKGELGSEERNTADLDFQHRFRTHERNEIIWGLGYRGTRGETEGSAMLHWDPATRTDHLFSFFVQDELRVHESLALIAGAKLEHNDYTQFELQPNARAMWTPTETQTVWAAVSRAVRTPSHTDHGVELETGIAPGMPPMRFVVVGDEGFVSEELVAYELGWRSQVSPKLSLDLALFYNDYDKLTSFEPGTATFDGTFIVVPLHFDNQISGETYGLELAADWRPAERWRVKTAYSLLQMSLQAAEESSDEQGAKNIEDSNPRHQGSLRVWHDVARNWEADGALYLVESLDLGDVPGYGRLDLRLGWKPAQGVELSLVAQGLFHDGEHELAEDFFAQRRDVEAAAYLKLRCTF